MIEQVQNIELINQIAMQEFATNLPIELSEAVKEKVNIIVNYYNSNWKNKVPTLKEIINSQINIHLEKNNIGTRNIFSGNLLRHSAYLNIKNNIKVIGNQKNADLIMNNAFWIGVWPGIDDSRINYIKSRFLNSFL